MIRYVLGKQIVKGDLNSDSGNLNEYTELGWELMVNRFRFMTSNIDYSNACVVTLKDRQFLYPFVKTEIYNSNENYDCDFVMDCENYLTGNVSNIHKDNANGFTQFSSLEMNIPECCIIHIRMRQWVAERNANLDKLNDLINSIKTFGIKIYIFGQGIESFFNEDETIQIVNLQEYATIMNNHNCKFMIGSMSGGTMISQICAREKLPTFVYETHSRNGVMNHPLFHADVVNFSKQCVEFISPNIGNNELMEKLKAIL